MKRSSSPLATILAALTDRARARNINDTRWAELAGVRKETLSRLRHRRSCDFDTLQSLSRVVGATIEVGDLDRRPLTQHDHFPADLTREYEEELLRLAASRNLDPARWKSYGPGFFMAGLAVMLGSVRGLERRTLMELAEALHPGVTEPAVFSLWLEKSPVRPSRFMPLLEQELRHAA